MKNIGAQGIYSVDALVVDPMGISAAVSTSFTVNIKGHYFTAFFYIFIGVIVFSFFVQLISLALGNLAVKKSLIEESDKIFKLSRDNKNLDSASRQFETKLQRILHTQISGEYKNLT